MSDFKPVALIKAAKTLNVGSATMVEFLQKKGFDIDNKPNTKLDESMYKALLKEFGDEKMLKEAAEAIQLGNKNKNIKLELAEDGSTKKVERDDEVLETKRVSLSGPKVVGSVNLEKDKKEEPKKEEPPKVEEVKKVAEQPTIKSEPENPNKVEIQSEKKQSDSEVKEKEEQVEKEIVDAKTEVAHSKDQIKEDFLETKKVSLQGFKVMGKVELKENKPKEKTEAEKSEGEKRVRKRFKKPAKVDPKKTSFAANKGKKPEEPKDKIVSEKEIEEKLKATMAKLQASTAGKNTRQKLRRAKRQNFQENERLEQEAQSELSRVLKVTEFITVSDVASMLGVSPTEIITKCFSLGVMVSINQRLDAEIIELIASEYDYDIEFISASDDGALDVEEDADEDLMPRGPVVTIMGHVDHGKTSLLDYIRKANVVAKEAGGITQHIGAYEVATEKGKITFLDTPGHEAFTAMRARGAKLTDVAVIVIAADDEVMPQTREAISHAQSAGVPMIFAINKIDKPNANPDNIKQQLSQMNLLVEEWGGKYQSQELSAKQGINVDLLLDKILLEAEMLELKANPNKVASGSVIEASLDKGRGYVATVLVQGGTLHVGDFLVAGRNSGKVKAMFNHLGENVKTAGPAQPVLILGLDGAPAAGERFKVFESEQEGKSVANKRTQLEREHGLRTKKLITLDEIGRRLSLGTFKELNIIVKGDVDGSIEALADSLLKLSTEEVQINILHKGVGAISESDIMLASASDAIIVGFQVRPSVQARRLAENEGVEIRLYSVIYKAIEEITAAIEGMLEPTIEEKITANLEVREVFKITKVGTIAGCFVTEGKVKRDSKVRVVRDGIVVYSGVLESLKRFKDDVKEVVSGQDCGLNVKNFNDVREGDIIEAYEEIEVKRKL